MSVDPVGEYVRVDVAPSGTACVDCENADPHGWWLHLRRCATCGHIGCCDSSPGQHATAHYKHSGHRVAQSFEPGEDWFYDYADDEAFLGPALTPPTSHPDDQTTPGPANRVPVDWQTLLH